MILDSIRVCVTLGFKTLASMILVCLALRVSLYRPQLTSHEKVKTVDHARFQSIAFPVLRLFA